MKKPPRIATPKTVLIAPFVYGLGVAILFVLVVLLTSHQRGGGFEMMLFYLAGMVFTTATLTAWALIRADRPAYQVALGSAGAVVLLFGSFALFAALSNLGQS